RAADVYALGATLYELLTGRPPFREETKTLTLAKVMTEEPEPPSRTVPGLSPELEAVCLRCLEKDPALRYPTAAELAEDLRRWERGESTRARPHGLPRRWWRATRRYRPALSVVALVLVAVLATGGGMYWWGNTPHVLPVATEPVASAGGGPDKVIGPEQT